MVVISAGLASRFTNFLGLSGEALSGELSVAVLRTSNGALGRIGKSFATEGVKGAVEGLISGAAGEVVLKAFRPRDGQKQFGRYLGSLEQQLSKEQALVE